MGKYYLKFYFTIFTFNLISFSASQDQLHRFNIPEGVISKQALFDISVVEPKRPQTPKPPFPYVSEDVKYANKKANITLAGTLTYPKNIKAKACVVLAHGSGGHTRNQDVGGHQTLFVLADYLTRNNIAVLRYDERGIGESTGNFTEARYKDFADDVVTGVEYMKNRKEFNHCKFGAIGHSKGGYTTILAANMSKTIQFIILLGGAGVDGEQLLFDQFPIVLKEDKNISDFDRKVLTTILSSKELFAIIRTTDDRDLMRKKVIDYIEKNIIIKYKDEYDLYLSFTNPWFKDFLLMNPKEVLRHLKKQAVLGLWGNKDLTVIAGQNIQCVREGLKLAGNRNHKLLVFDGINHLFQRAETGLVSEYFEIEETIAPFVLKYIAKWIRRNI